MPTKDSLSKRRTHKIIERLKKEKTKNHTRRKKKRKIIKRKQPFHTLVINLCSFALRCLYCCNKPSN